MRGWEAAIALPHSPTRPLYRDGSDHHQTQKKRGKEEEEPKRVRDLHTRCDTGRQSKPKGERHSPLLDATGKKTKKKTIVRTPEKSIVRPLASFCFLFPSILYTQALFHPTHPLTHSPRKGGGESMYGGGFCSLSFLFLFLPLALALLSLSRSLTRSRSFRFVLLLLLFVVASSVGLRCLFPFLFLLLPLVGEEEERQRHTTRTSSKLCCWQGPSWV